MHTDSISITLKQNLFAQKFFNLWTKRAKVELQELLKALVEDSLNRDGLKTLEVAELTEIHRREDIELNWFEKIRLWFQVSLRKPATRK